MCGIFGYIGKDIAITRVVEGLERLEYRGYDSCGVAGIRTQKLFLRKQEGKISELKKALRGSLSTKLSPCLSHTRWATHGRPNHANAHPHLDCKNHFVVVHNGIIENYLSLKDNLLKDGHIFRSDTDTEVIAHLLESLYKGSLEEAVRLAVKKLVGSFALGVISVLEPDMLIGVRKSSPLIVGLSKEGSFLASDIPAILPFTKRVVYLKDEEIAVLKKDKLQIFNFKKEPLRLKIEHVNIKAEAAEKKGFSHFMLKEIFEQPEVLDKIISLYLKKDRVQLPQLNLSERFLKKVKNVFITACGTAYHAGYVAKYFLEKYCGLDVEIDTSSEFRYRTINIRKGDLLLAISQSGETADTLEATREAKRAGARVLSILNVLGSSLAKESDGIIFTHAGPEIGVASTKAYTAQIAVLILFSLHLARIKKTIPPHTERLFKRELKKISDYQRMIVGKDREIKTIAEKFSQFGCFLFLGRGINYPSALEGALKLKEISYIPAEGYPAGEMKHGPIALIDEYRAVICIAPSDHLYEKMISNIQEIKARKGKVLAIVNYADTQASRLSDETIHIPKLDCEDFSPLLIAPVLQLFAYHVAKNLGREIDQPRNLAKSVTVE